MKFFFYGIALVVIVLDQYTKMLAVQHLQFATPVPVMSYLNWTLLHNTGAAFSFLSDAGGWQHWFLGGLAVVVSIFIVIYIWRLPSSARWLPVSLALVLGGALGNFYDRVTLGYVVDFIDVYVNQCGFLERWLYRCHWPAFNIADSAIFVGAIMLLIDAFFLAEEENADD